MSADEAVEFIQRLQNEGTGVRLDATWVANPAPYDRKIALSRHEDNSLNFHLVDSGCKISVGSCFDEPSPVIVEHSSRYVRFGNVQSMILCMSYFGTKRHLVTDNNTSIERAVANWKRATEKKWVVSERNHPKIYPKISENLERG